MPIDPSILLKFQSTPQIESPVNALAKGMQLQALQDESDLNSLRRTEIQRNFDQEAALGELFSRPDFDLTSRQSLAEIGRRAPGKFPAYAKLATEMDKERRAAEKARLESVGQTLKIGRDLFAGANTQDQWTAARNWIGQNAPDVVDQIPPMWSPVNRQNIILSADKLADQINQRVRSFSLPAGGQQFEFVNGAPVEIASAPPLPLPANLQVLAGSGDTGGEIFVTTPSRTGPSKIERIQLPPGVGPRTNPPQRQTAKVYDEASERELLIDPSVYQGGGIGSPGVIGPVAPSAAAAKAAKVQEDKDKAYTAFKNEVDDILVRFRKLDEMKAVTSTKAGVVENLGRAASGSGLGQFAGRITGSEAQKERDVIAGSNSRLIGQIAQITGRTSSQLNTDKELQFFLKSLSDPANTSLEAAEDNLAKLVTYVETLATKPPPETTTTTPRTTAPKPAAPANARPSLDDIFRKK
jgi:hypothetical protein